VRPSLFQRWFSKKGKVPVPFSRPEDLDFTLFPPQKNGGKVLYDDGRVRVTPGFIQIGDGRMIVVSKIRELRRGLIWEPGLAGLIYRMLLISFFSDYDLWAYAKVAVFFRLSWRVGLDFH